MRKKLENCDRCPLCGHKLKKTKTMTAAAITANRENGKRGGRPRKSETNKK